MSFEIDGLDETIETLEDLASKAEELDGDHQIPLVELFTESFMQQNSEFDSIEQFFEESPWEIDSQEDLEEVPQEDMDEYVDEHTVFPDTDEMTDNAGEEWVAKQLGLK